MTLLERLPPVAAARPPADSPYGGLARWAPFALTLLVILGVLGEYGVPLWDSARFLTYITFGVTVPGTLLWRVLMRRPAPLAEDLAAGTALGYAVEVLAYIPARGAGVPMLCLLPPALTIVVFLAVPGLRTCWRGSAPVERPPLWWLWTPAALLSSVMLWSAPAFFRDRGLGWLGHSASWVDLPFVLALAGEVKHHVPPMEPHVVGEPLSYHWFVFAEVAATSWATGIELDTLLTRLSPLPMLAVFVIATMALARRVGGAGGWWTGPVAIAIGFLVIAPNPYRWSTQAPPATNLFGQLIWLSPTQTFGAALFAVTMLPLIDLLRGRRTGPGGWAAPAVLLIVLAGAKATYLPLLLAGLSVLAAVHLVTRRSLPRVPAALAAIVLSCLVFAQVVLFHGVSQGLKFAPLNTVRRIAFSSATRLSEPLIAGPFWLAASLAAMFVLGWLTTWAGVYGLVRARVLDPAIVVFVGMGATGIGVVLLVGHPAGGQMHFFQGAGPYLALASAAGLAYALPAGVQARRAVPALVAAACAGAAVAMLARAVGDPLPPRPSGPLWWPLLSPYLLLIITAAAAALLVVRVRGLGVAMVLVMLTALGLPPLWNRITLTEREPMTRAWLPPADGIAAARWLRGHSRTTDVVATNAQCLKPRRRGCQYRHFWVAAYAERRVLVEGWTQAASSLARISDLYGQPMGEVPFWDQRRLADNRAAFQAPSARTVAELKRKYGVRWLLVDGHVQPPSPRLGEYAQLRHSAGRCAVYEL